jgi:hypothetical protein
MTMSEDDENWRFALLLATTLILIVIIITGACLTASIHSDNSTTQQIQACEQSGGQWRADASGWMGCQK